MRLSLFDWDLFIFVEDINFCFVSSNYRAYGIGENYFPVAQSGSPGILVRDFSYPG